MNTPLVSVVIPTRNRADMLRKAIAAVEAQDYPNLEILVVDNGSTDHTPQVVKESSARYVLNPIPGVSISRQVGIESSKGEIVAMCDDDTVPNPDWLRLMVECLLSDEKLGLVGGLTINHGFKGIRVYKGRGKIGRNATITVLEDPTDSDYFASMNTAFKRSVMQEIGGYDLFYRTGSYEEPDIAFRMKAKGYRIQYVPDSILNHYHTTVSHRRRFAFYNSQLMRLYFFMKHMRPKSIGGWLSFAGYELKLMAQELFQIAKEFVSATIRLKFDRWSNLGFRFFNSFSARVAIPWLLRKARQRETVEGSTETRQSALKSFKFAYVSRVRYPDAAASALQIFRMAAALSYHLDTTLFVHDLGVPEAELRAHYGVQQAPLKTQSLRSGRWPKVLYGHPGMRYLTYNWLLALLLATHRSWRRTGNKTNIFFVRSRREIIFWGLRRRYFPWLRHWLFVCELHDTFLPDESVGSWNSSKAVQLGRALKSYDLVLALTNGLAKDVRDLTNDSVVPHVVPGCTGLERKNQSQMAIDSNTETQKRILLGYTGSVDLLHGVSDLFEALHRLPDHFALRVVGRLDSTIQNMLDQYQANHAFNGNLEIVNHVPYSHISEHIDECDILLVPAGSTHHSQNYRSPLKIFDYMARGKPIVAADAPAHKEILQDGVNARLYRTGDPEDLAKVICSLSEDHEQMRAIALKAWQQSAEYTYDKRAQRIWELVKQVP